MKPRMPATTAPATKPMPPPNPPPRMTSIPLISILPLSNKKAPPTGVSGACELTEGETPFSHCVVEISDAKAPVGKPCRIPTRRHRYQDLSPRLGQGDTLNSLPLHSQAVCVGFCRYGALCQPLWAMGLAARPKGQSRRHFLSRSTTPCDHAASALVHQLACATSARFENTHRTT